MSHTKILIASSSIDLVNWKPVADILHRSGYGTIIYEADKVAAGVVQLGIHLDRTMGLSITYDSRPLTFGEVGAAWYRRSTMFGEQDDKTRQLSLSMERREIQYSLWNIVPERAWLNTPRRISHAGHKLTQLELARQIGFEIPTTVVANTWEPIRKKLPKKIIFKPSYTTSYMGNDLTALYTTPLDNAPQTLPTEHIPFPGLWQTYFPKAREWRITIVGDKAFDAAIYTDKTAQDDWRKHQHKPNVVFKHGVFPDDQKKKCFEFLRRFGLRYGAFDFIEDHDGRIIFLECNPNGQFGWLEDELDLPISKAIADELIKIAKGY